MASGLDEPFASWEEFKSTFCERLFPSKPFYRGKYLFRGHSNSSWQLKTTFDRMFHNQSSAMRLDIAYELLDSFKRGLQDDSIPPTVWDNDKGKEEKENRRYLALGQHYGLPTRLLDWTESPYVAAFFAYNNRALWEVPDQSIAIWVLDAKDPIWHSEFGVEIIDVPYVGNKRIRNQAGKFTLSRTPFPDLESYVAAHGDKGRPLRKFLLPASDYAKALADLDAMGIHHGTLYPDIEGAAQMALARVAAQYETAVQSRPARPT